jgi:hypothetical protein
MRAARLVRGGKYFSNTNAPQTRRIEPDAPADALGLADPARNDVARCEVSEWVNVSHDAFTAVVYQTSTCAPQGLRQKRQRSRAHVERRWMKLHELESGAAGTGGKCHGQAISAGAGRIRAPAVQRPNTSRCNDYVTRPNSNEVSIAGHRKHAHHAPVCEQADSSHERQQLDM